MVQRQGEHPEASRPLWLSQQHQDQLLLSDRLLVEPALEWKDWSTFPKESVVVQKMEIFRFLWFLSPYGFSGKLTSNIYQDAKLPGILF